MSGINIFLCFSKMEKIPGFTYALITNFDTYVLFSKTIIPVGTFFPNHKLETPQLIFLYCWVTKGPPRVRKFFVRVRYFLEAERDFWKKKNPRVCTKPSAAAVRLTPKFHSDLFLIISFHKYFDFRIVAVLSTFVNKLDFFSILNTYRISSYKALLALFFY